MIDRRLLGNLLALILVSVTSVGWANAVELSQEYRIKSAYLLNFTKFISWPEGTFQTADQALQLCIQNHQEMANFLHAMAAAQTPGKNKLIVNIKNVTELEELVGCHIFYIITPLHEYEYEHSKPYNLCKCLIIGDTPMHQSWGSTINFYHDERRIRFAVDLKKLHRMNISISSELLKLASIYNKMSTRANN